MPQGFVRWLVGERQDPGQTIWSQVSSRMTETGVAAISVVSKDEKIKEDGGHGIQDSINGAFRGKMDAATWAPAFCGLSAAQVSARHLLGGPVSARLVVRAAVV